jgi:hypothetical protein
MVKAELPEVQPRRDVSFHSLENCLMTSAIVSTHFTFGCVKPSDYGRTPMMAYQGTNGRPTWRSIRALVTEHGIA